MVARLISDEGDLERAIKTGGKRLSIGRISAPEEIADGILYMCSDRSSFMIGHAMVLDGGLIAG